MSVEAIIEVFEISIIVSDIQPVTVGLPVKVNIGKTIVGIVGVSSSAVGIEIITNNISSKDVIFIVAVIAVLGFPTANNVVHIIGRVPAVA